MRAINKKKLIDIILLLGTLILTNLSGQGIIPVTGDETITPQENIPLTNIDTEIYAGADLTSIGQFVESITDGQSDAIRGVFVTDKLALEVVQQPSSNAAYVSTEAGKVTQFSMARQYDTLGFLAHNYLAGATFFDLYFGDIIQVVYGDGSIDFYQVAEIYRYQALSPNSAYSQFLDLETGEQYSATDVFYQMYTGEHHLTLQTCIQEGDVDSWGRLFIIAYPL